MTDDFSLNGMRALVTGGTGGIGEAIVRAFAAAGATCIVHGRNAERARSIADEVGGIAAVGDLAEPGTCETLIERAAQSGGLDILVNNAGYEVRAHVEELGAEELARIMAVNFAAPAALMRLSLPLLRRSENPSIINVTSIHESVPVAANGGYAAAKAALASLSKTASVELGPQRIRVNTLAPGAILTDMNRDLIEQVGERSFREWIPLGRVGSVDEVASVAVFLASRAARYITGASIVADGGYSNNLVRYPDPAAQGSEGAGR